LINGLTVCTFCLIIIILEQTQEFLAADQVKPEILGTPDYLAPEVLLGLGHSKSRDEY
jgi:serine/threonine protein kinase